MIIQTLWSVHKFPIKSHNAWCIWINKKKTEYQTHSQDNSKMRSAMKLKRRWPLSKVYWTVFFWCYSIEYVGMWLLFFIRSICTITDRMANKQRDKQRTLRQSTGSNGKTNKQTQWNEMKSDDASSIRFFGRLVHSQCFHEVMSVIIGLIGPFKCHTGIHLDGPLLTSCRICTYALSLVQSVSILQIVFFFVVKHSTCESDVVRVYVWWRLAWQFIYLRDQQSVLNVEISLRVLPFTFKFELNNRTLYIRINNCE